MLPVTPPFPLDANADRGRKRELTDAWCGRLDHEHPALVGRRGALARSRMKTRAADRHARTLDHVTVKKPDRGPRHVAAHSVPAEGRPPRRRRRPCPSEPVGGHRDTLRRDVERTGRRLARLPVSHRDSLPFERRSDLTRLESSPLDHLSIDPEPASRHRKPRLPAFQGPRFEGGATGGAR